jgi:diazepam-binding inhibitor (GABA receptor modulating acyl-CoA-binding protein)
MSLEDDFAQAQDRVKTLPAPPNNEKLLELYSLFKQAKEGDARGKRPGMLDIKGRAKYDAWARRKGTSAQDAMSAYVALVASLTG